MQENNKTVKRLYRRQELFHSRKSYYEYLSKTTKNPFEKIRYRMRELIFSDAIQQTDYAIRKELNIL